MTLGRPGDLLADRYRLDRFVSGAGTVERWRAYDERLARPVTARLEPATGDSREQDGAIAAARPALATIAGLNHPGVAAVYDMGLVDDLRGVAVGYAISEWTEGRTLGEIMATGPQPWQRIADWGRQISAALAALHEIGMVHGGLSPESVAVHDDRQVKILDVGLDDGGEDLDPAAESAADGPAKAVTDGTADADAGAGAHKAATADAAEAPAQAAADVTAATWQQQLPAGAPDDVYALGFMLWEATVGAAPEYVGPAGQPEEGRGETASEAQDGERAAAPTAAGLDQRPLLEAGAPVGFAALLADMLAGDPALRPTALEAEDRFAPFAVSERGGETLPGIAAVPAHTQVLGPALAGAGAAGGRKPQDDRRRGPWLGLVLLVAAVLAGLGLLLANLNSHPGGSGNLNPVIPPNSPGTVTLPDGTVSTVASRPATRDASPGASTPSAPPKSAATSQAPASPSAPASSAPPESPSSVPSDTASAPGGPGAGGGSASAPAGGPSPPNSPSVPSVQQSQ